MLELQEEKAHSLMLLSLFNEVFNGVSKELIVVGFWLKFEKLFMMISIYNKLLLKRRYLGLRMRKGMPLKKHIDELNSILMELCEIDVKKEDKDLTMILLAFLPPSYENFVSSLSLSNDFITLKEVKASLYSRELLVKASRNNDEASTFGLLVVDSAKGQ